MVGLAQFASQLSLMNPFEKHQQDLIAAKLLVGKTVTAQRPNTHNEANKITGVVVSVRECIEDYYSLRPSRILIDINRNGTITPCEFQSIF